MTTWTHTQHIPSIDVHHTKIGIFTLRIHRHLVGNINRWYLSTEPRLLPVVALDSEDLDEAKKQALDVLRKICVDTSREILLFHSSPTQ